MSSSRNNQIKSQQNQWQNTQFQKSEINYQNKSQNAYFDENNSQYESEFELKHDSLAYYDDEEYYEKKFNEEDLKSSIVTKSKNIQSTKSNQKTSRAHFEKILNNELTHMSKSSQLTLKCRLCEKKFYSNNKLHKHLRASQHSQNQQSVRVLNREQIENISVVISTREYKEYKEFAFREHQYARVKRKFASNEETHDLCADSETSMSFVDSKFLAQTNVNVKITSFKIQIRDIDSKTHDTSKYCLLDLYFRENFKKNSRMTHIKEEFHLINDLNVNMLIDVDILNFEECILNFKRKTMIFFVCENTKMSITILRTNQSVNRSVFFANKIVVSSRINMTMLIKIRDKTLLDRNYIFNSKDETLLSSKEDFFNHILINNSMKVLMKNISDQVYVIFKNYRVSKINDYHENECFLISSENNHLTIAFNKLFNQKIDLQKLQNLKKLEIILSNEITIHDDKVAIKRITDVINQYLDVWKNVSKSINISQKRWMNIKTILETNSETCRIYKLEIKNQTVIDKEFDVLHDLSKMKWASKSTSYAYSIFVVWIITHLMKKSFTRRERMIVDIRELNKIFEHDVYSMSLQSDILNKIQKCSYISIMNCTTFFHQWRITILDKHKLIVVTYRNVEQWNVDVMNHRNTSAYVQREMNNILRKYSWVKKYIDDVIVFSKTLKEHLKHLNQLFALFEKLNITLKTKKTYFEYFSISLLKQKIDSLDFITAENKLKMIVKLSFFKTLKDLKKYLDAIDWLRDYVVYYAQKAESFQERKTNLLKKESIKRKSRKFFNLKILIENSSSIELDVYNQLQSNFNRARWLTHYNKIRQLYVDVNVSKKEFEVIMYHLKKEIDEKFLKESSSKRDIKSILFLNKTFFSAKSRYWSTKLKMTKLI
jgi:hypothetical protein